MIQHFSARMSKKTFSILSAVLGQNELTLFDLFCGSGDYKYSEIIL